MNTVNVSAFDMPPPPPAVGVETVTGTIAAVATSAAEIAAFNPVALVNVVVRGLLFHWTIEHGTKVPPLAPLASTPRRNAADPAGVLDGMSVAIAGVGSGVVEGATVKGEDREAKDEFVALDTVIFTGVAGNAVSVAVIAAVSCVALTKVVARGEPFQLTTSPLGTKFVPFTVRVIPAGLHAGVEFVDVEDAESDVMVGRTIGNGIAFDAFALAAGLATATLTVSTAAIFAAVTEALSWVELTKVVVSCVRLLLVSTHCTFEHGRKFVPDTISGNAAVPAVAPAGEMDVTVGVESVEAEIVKDAGAELTPELDTVIEADPAFAISGA